MKIEEAMAETFRMIGNIYKELEDMEKRENLNQKSLSNILKSIDALNDKMKDLSDRVDVLEKLTDKILEKMLK